MGLREGAGGIGDGCALALVGLVLDLMHEGVAAPALFQCLTRIPNAGRQVFYFLNEDDVMSLAQLSDCSEWFCDYQLGCWFIVLGHGWCSFLICSAVFW